MVMAVASSGAAPGPWTQSRAEQDAGSRRITFRGIPKTSLLAPIQAFSLSSPKAIRRYSGIFKLKVVCATGDGLKKVQEIIGRANGEDRRNGFGPPPPKHLEGGSGFVNLVGMDDLMSGKRDFNIRAEKNEKIGGSTPDEILPETNGPVSNLEERKELKGLESSQTSSFLLPNKLTQPQRIATLGMIFFTIIAFGNGSQEVFPEDILQILQNLMRFAWISHTVSGIIAAVIVYGKGEPPLKWFVKVLGSGLLGLQEAVLLPDKK